MLEMILGVGLVLGCRIVMCPPLWVYLHTRKLCNAVLGKPAITVWIYTAHL